MTALKDFAPLLGYRVHSSELDKPLSPEDVLLEKRNWVVTEWQDKMVYLPYETGIKTHLAVFGKSGTGKTRFNMHLLRIWLRAGFPAIVLDPKDETHLQAMAVAESVKVPPDAVILTSPIKEMSGGSVVSFNPFTVHPGEEAYDVGEAFAKTMHDLYKDSWGPNMGQILMDATNAVVAHGLSPYELRDFLLNDAYREALLARDPFYPGPAYTEARNYFQKDFRRQGDAKRLESVRPIINKLGEFRRNPYYLGTFGSRGDQLDLRDLGDTTRLLLVHLNAATGDPKAPTLLAALITGQLFRTASNKKMNLPVLLIVDEIGNQGKEIGELFTNIMRIGRSRNIHLLVSTQVTEDLPETLRNAAFNTISTRVFFRAGKDIAAPVADDLAGEWQEGLTKKQWYEVLRTLPRRHAVLQLDGRKPAIFRAARLELETPSDSSHRTVLEKNRSRSRQDADIAWRIEQIERLAEEAPPTPSPTKPPKPSPKVVQEEPVVSDDGFLT